MLKIYNTATRQLETFTPLEDGKVKIIFHPLAKDAKHPKANVFTVKLAKADVDKIKKAL